MCPSRSHLVLGLTVGVLVVGVSGCWGPKRHDVTGQVKFKGSVFNKPNGKIVFVGPRGIQVAAAINPDGTYRAVKVVAGLNRVAVYYPNPDYQIPKRHRTRPKEDEPAPEAAAAQTVFLTPSHYANVDTSGLSVEVTAGTVFDVNLTDPPKEE